MSNLAKRDTILVVDDDLHFRKLISLQIMKMGYNVIEAGNGNECLDLLSSEPYRIGVVLLDHYMSSLLGVEVLEVIHETYSDIPVIIITSTHDVKIIVQAMKAGAFDYLVKPIDYEHLETVIKNAISLNKLKDEIDGLREKVNRSEIFANIIGESKALLEVFEITEKVLKKDSNVLILGESGTGKELFARAIHDASIRKDRPFVVVNCAALTSELADSLLFGHNKGAFTGAIKENIGFFEQAAGGTIFLDEIGDMQIDIQAKVLRVIESKKVRRVGEKIERAIDFRIISATNRDLTKDMETGQFRNDLFFRLEEYPLYLPPLRKRKEDIPVLARHFLREFCDFYELDQMEISENVMQQLIDYSWPGNVRELKNVIRRSAVQNVDPIIESVVFSGAREENENAGESIKEQHTVKQETNYSEITPLRILEQNEILKAYHLFEGNIDRMVVALEMSRATLYRKLKKYNIQVS